MRKDIPVCEFDIRDVDENRVAVELLQVFDDKRMPLEMQLEPNMAHYLIKRLAPTVYSNLGYNVLLDGEPLASSLENIIDYTGALSLIDDFWMARKDNKTMKWSECNLFSNEISEAVADLAFTGEGTYEITEFTRSPEFTTDGMVNKAWRRIDGTTYLYKASLSWKGQYGTEQFSEYYASQIAEKLQLKHVSYDLDVWKDNLCSACKLFTSERYSYIAAKKISLDLDAFIRSLERDSRLYQELADILLFDALAMNIRHLGNFGFIQDNETFDIVGLMPIFDNGMSLFGDVSNKELANPGYRSVFFALGERMYATIAPKDIKAMLTDRQRKLAKEMVGFKFKRHSEYNLFEDMLKTLESIINDRALFLSR